MSLAQSNSHGTAAVFGVVTGVGVPAIVYLQSPDDNPTRYYDGYQASTEKDGSFSFLDIRPGTYLLRAEASGFMSAVAGHDGLEITLHEDEKRKGIEIALVPRPVLCGRVTEGGKPKLTWVNAFRYDPAFDSFSRTFLPSTQTDGSFSFLDLDPGTYYLQGYTTWYPGSFSFNGAKPVILDREARPNQCPIDIPLQYTGCRGTKVSGQITAVNSNDNTQYRVNFLERSSTGGRVATVIAMDGASANNLYKAGDSFSGTVCPGDYDVVLSDRHPASSWVEPRSSKVIFDSQRLTVRQTEVDGLRLTPRAMATINGEVHFEGITRYASCPGLGGQHVDILREGDGQFQSATLDQKDRFQIQNVAPGEYSIYLGPFLREAVYVKSVVVNSKTLTDRRFSVSSPEPITIEITLSGDLANAPGHIAPDLRTEQRWEVAWTRPKGSVAGKVEGNVDGGYTVKLLPARYNSNASGEYATHTAPDGSFQFNSIDPGVYTLRAESNDSIPFEYGSRQAGQRGTPIIVSRGTRVENLHLSPPKLGGICGRVIDANGSPQPGLRIFLMTVESGHFVDKSPGNIYPEQQINALETDSTGHFRAERLAPGEYFFIFLSGYFEAFFSPDGGAETAKPVRVPLAKDVGCGTDTPVELRMPAAVKKQDHTVSGKVEGDLPKKVGDRFWISMTWDPRGHVGQVWGGVVKLDHDHRFRVDHVPNGRFLLELYSAYGPEPVMGSGPYRPVSHLLSRQTFEVHDQDVADLKVTPVRLPSVSGTVHFEQIPTEWKGFDVSQQAITLVPVAYRAPFSAKLSSDGHFSIDPEDPGDYEVTLDQLRDPLYIRSVRLDGHEISGRYLQLRAGQSAHLEVFVNGNGGQVSSSVSPDPFLPIPEPSVSETCGSRVWPEYQLLLFPFHPALARSTTLAPTAGRIIRGYRVGDANRPTLQAGAVPPGRYRAIVAAHLWLDPLFGRTSGSTNAEREIWSAVAALGQPITVKAGGKVDIVLEDKTVDIARFAARAGVPLDGAPFSLP